MNDDSLIATNTPTTLDDWPRFLEHSLLDAAVTEAARELQISQEMALMCAFGAMTTACQGHSDVKMPTGHQVPTSLMLLTIAESGERKTTAQNYFFEAINALNSAAHQANEVDLMEHRVKHQLWNTRKRHLERMYSKCATQGDEKSTLSALDTVADHVRAEPKPVRSNKFLYEDTTPQALVQMLYENTRNACLLTSEASSIFSGKALGELDKLNTLWDGGNVSVDRVSRESFILQNSRLTLSLMAQPSVIARFMSKRGEEARGTGFLARFLIARPRPMAGGRSDKKLSELPRRQAFNARIRELMDFTASPHRPVLQFSEPASDRWYQYSKQLEEGMRENGLYYYLKDHASKLLENTSRLAAILHTFERTSNSNTEIDLRTLEFCWQFAQTCSGHFIKHIANEPQLITDANNLAHYLLKAAYKNSLPAEIPEPSSRNGGAPQSQAGSSRPNNLKPGANTTFTLTELKQFGPSSLRGRAGSERLDAAIALLTKIGHIAKEGSRYLFKETILLKWGREPELKNGELLTIKELPLFKEQECWGAKHGSSFASHNTYYIVVHS